MASGTAEIKGRRRSVHLRFSEEDAITLLNFLVRVCGLTLPDGVSPWRPAPDLEPAAPPVKPEVQATFEAWMDSLPEGWWDDAADGGEFLDSLAAAFAAGRDSVTG